MLWNIPVRTFILTIFISTALLFALLLPQTAQAQKRMCVTSDIANLRSGPGTNHDVLWQVEQFHPFIIIDKKGNWYHIKDFDGDTAWVHESIVGKVESVITVKKKCNIRSGPDTKNAIVFTAERGVPFKVLKKTGNWLKIQHADKSIGWIHKTLVW